MASTMSMRSAATNHPRWPAVKRYSTARTEGDGVRSESRMASTRSAEGEEAFVDQFHGLLEPGGLELLPAVERQTKEAHHLVQMDTSAKSVSFPRPVATLDHVRVEEARAKLLRGDPSLARVHPEVGEELREVERRFRPADGIEVDETAPLPGEDQLRVGEVPVAEAGLPGIGCRRAGAQGLEPPLELGSETGGHALQGGKRVAQLDQLVVDPAPGSERDPRAVQGGRDPRGRLDRCRKRPRAVVPASVPRPVLQQRSNPGPARDGLQQRQLQRFDEAERSRDGERRVLASEDALAELGDDGRGERAAMIGRDLAVDGDRPGLLAGPSRAVDGVAEDAAVLTAIVTEVHMAARRGEPPGPRVRKRAAEDIEHRGRVRHVDQRGELAVDGEQRNRHGERLQYRN